MNNNGNNSNQGLSPDAKALLLAATLRTARQVTPHMRKRLGCAVSKVLANKPVKGGDAPK